MLINKQWFKQNQDILCWMANTDYGRDLLVIDKKYPKVIEIGKNYIKCQIEPGKYLYDFRTHDKWVKAVTYRWKEFQFYSQYYQKVIPLLSYSRLGDLYLVATTTTAYPDPGDPGSTTCDGVLYRNNTEDWASIVAGAGSGVLSITAATGEFTRIDTPNGTQWNVLTRSHFGFDTSAIPDTETISAATASFFGSTKANAGNWGDSDFGLSLVAHTPASNTTLQAADYNTATYGTTKFASDISYTNASTVAYNDMAMNASGIAAISKTGVTSLGGRNPADIAASLTHTGSSGQSNIIVIFADTALTTTDPKLVVTSAVASTTVTKGTLKSFGTGGLGSGSAGGSHGF
jgi:hypothetical protein